MDSEEKWVALLRRAIREEFGRGEPGAVTFEEAAKRLSCSPRHISRLVHQGDLMPTMVGSLRRIPMSEIRRLSTPAQAPTVTPSSAQRKAVREHAKKQRSAKTEADAIRALARKR